MRSASEEPCVPSKAKRWPGLDERNGSRGGEDDAAFCGMTKKTAFAVCGGQNAVMKRNDGARR